MPLAAYALLLRRVASRGVEKGRGTREQAKRDDRKSFHRGSSISISITDHVITYVVRCTCSGWED